MTQDIKIMDTIVGRVKQNIVMEFCLLVHERALQLMEQDGKVEGKHFAAMKQILSDYGVGINFETPTDSKITLVKAQQ